MKKFLSISAAIMGLTALVFGAGLFQGNSSIVTVQDKAMAEYGECAVHTYPDEYIVVSAATCASTGLQYRICAVCGFRDIVTTEINPENHGSTSADWFYDVYPTCTDEGIKFHRCNLCGEKCDITTAEIDPDAHKHGGQAELIAPSTCSSSGLEAYLCILCGQYYNETVIPSNPEGHVVNDSSRWDVTLLPTCGTDGELTGYCALCGEAAAIRPILAHGVHSWAEEITVDAEATCVDEGRTSRHCTVCDEVTEVTIIPADESYHSFSTRFTTDTAATCVSEGEESRHCIYCDERIEITSIPIDANGHLFSGEWIISKEATCDETGLRHQLCRLCGEASISVIIPKVEHTYPNEYETLSESADGLSARVKYICTVCGNEYITVISFADENEPNASGKLILIPNEDSVIAVDSEAMIVTNIARLVSPIALTLSFKNGSSFLVMDENGELANSQYVGTGFSLSYEAVGGIPTNYYLSVTGDVDSDGNVTSADARIILRYAASLQSLEGVFLSAADVNADGSVNAADARKALRVSAALDYIESTYKN